MDFNMDDSYIDPEVMNMLANIDQIDLNKFKNKINATLAYLQSCRRLAIYEMNRRKLADEVAREEQKLADEVAREEQNT